MVIKYLWFYTCQCNKCIWKLDLWVVIIYILYVYICYIRTSTSQQALQASINMQPIFINLLTVIVSIKNGGRGVLKMCYEIQQKIWIWNFNIDWKKTLFCWMSNCGSSEGFCCLCYYYVQKSLQLFNILSHTSSVRFTTSYLRHNFNIIL